MLTVLWIRSQAEEGRAAEALRADALETQVLCMVLTVLHMALTVLYVALAVLYVALTVLYAALTVLCMALTGEGRAAEALRADALETQVTTMKITTHLEHVSLCKTASGTNRSSRWTY